MSVTNKLFRGRGRYREEEDRTFFVLDSAAFIEPRHIQRRFIFRRPGNDLLSHTLRCSTIGAEAFNFRVRDGIGFRRFATVTKSAQYETNNDL